MLPLTEADPENRQMPLKRQEEQWHRGAMQLLEERRREGR